MSAITKISPKNDENVYSISLSIIFTALVVGAIIYLKGMNRLPTEISVFDAVLIILAVFRLTRLMVYDKIMTFVRDMFVKKEEKEGEGGAIYVVRRKFDKGFRKSISDLLDCPWCISVWLSLIVPFFYFVSPIAWFPIFVLAVSGFATLLQILINLIGWRAEQARMLTLSDNEDMGNDVLNIK